MIHLGLTDSLAVACRPSFFETCGILVTKSGIEPESSVLQGGVLTTGPPGKSLWLAINVTLSIVAVFGCIIVFSSHSVWVILKNVNQQSLPCLKSINVRMKYFLWCLLLIFNITITVPYETLKGPPGAGPCPPVDISLLPQSPPSLAPQGHSCSAVCPCRVLLQVLARVAPFY